MMMNRIRILNQSNKAIFCMYRIYTKAILEKIDTSLSHPTCLVWDDAITVGVGGKSQQGSGKTLTLNVYMRFIHTFGLIGLVMY
jgi:hypothetical protein